MKKLWLVSMMHDAADRIREAEPDLVGRTVAYIPTAVIAEGPEGALEEMAAEETKMLESLGLTVDMLEISTAPAEKIKESLEKCDLIFVGGGNTFFLLQELKRTGADKLLVREVEKGKMYIGESAGAVVACPDIGYCAGMDDPGKAPELTEYSGLHLVDFYVVPHLGNPQMGPAAEQAIADYSGKLDLKVIDDQQMILVEDGKVSIL